MHRGEMRYEMCGTTGTNLGSASVESSDLDDTDLQSGNRYRIHFVAKGIPGGAVPWTPSFQREVEQNLAKRGVKARVVKVTQGGFEPTSGSSTLDWISDWIPGASSVLPSRDLLGNFTFSMDIDILPGAGGNLSGMGILPVGYAVGIGIVAAVVALSVLAPSIIVTAVENLGKAAGGAVTGVLTGLGPIGIAAVAGGIFLWMKYSKKGRAAKAKYLG